MTAPKGKVFILAQRRMFRAPLRPLRPLVEAVWLCAGGAGV